MPNERPRLGLRGPADEDRHWDLKAAAVGQELAKSQAMIIPFCKSPHGGAGLPSGHPPQGRRMVVSSRPPGLSVKKPVSCLLS